MLVCTYNIYVQQGQTMLSYKRFDLFSVSQYIAANPGVQGAYMPQYPPMQAAAVSSL